VLRTSIQRPVVMMLDSSVLQILSIYGGTLFAFYYILATTLPGILAKVYGFSPALTGYSFLAFSKDQSFDAEDYTNINRYWGCRRYHCVQPLS
jgi:hypothetical protein